MVLAIAASKGWTIRSTDIKSAFLQGEHLEREVFLTPPKESSTPQGHIWKLRRCLYGLNDAARQFYNSLSKELVQLGCVKCSLDPALFMVFHGSELAGVLVSHVDDFLHAGNSYFDDVIMTRLYDRFSAGSKESKTFVYTGYHISQAADSSIVLDQQVYLDSIDVSKVDAVRMADKQVLLSPQDQSVYRSLVGKLGWLVQGTRPDLSFFWLEASTKNRSACMGDLVTLSKTLLNAKLSAGTVFFPSLGDFGSWKIFVYSDAAYANLCDGTSSTGGCIVFLVGDKGSCCPLLWKGCKLRRVCRSSAAAEGLSLSEAIDEAVYLRIMLCQLIGVEVSHVPLIAFTDNAGLQLNTSNVLHPKVCDKRLKIEIAHIRQSIACGEVQEIVWCNSKSQLADCLTKKGASSVGLMQVLQTGLMPSA